MREHPTYDEFWTSRVADLTTFDVPVWLVSSWANAGIHTRGTLQAWDEIASTDKWIDLNARKEWSYFYQPEMVAKQMAFFDRFLRGNTSAIDDWPRVLCQVRDRLAVNHHRTDIQYPLTGTEYRRMFLDAETGTLDYASPSVESSCSYAAKTGNATFSFTFTESTEIIGPASLRLCMSAQGADDADIFVGLRKYDANGQEVNFEYLGFFENGIVGLGWQRLSLRALDEAKSTEAKPYPRFTTFEHVYNDEIVRLEIPILDSATRFEAGERLELDIRGHDHINGGGMIPQHPENRNRGNHVIYTGGQHSSSLLLPFVPIAAPE
jgi:hypothetical protein